MRTICVAVGCCWERDIPEEPGAGHQFVNLRPTTKLQFSYRSWKIDGIHTTSSERNRYHQSSPYKSGGTCCCLLQQQQLSSIHQSLNFGLVSCHRHRHACPGEQLSFCWIAERHPTLIDNRVVDSRGRERRISLTCRDLRGTGSDGENLGGECFDYWLS